MCSRQRRRSATDAAHPLRVLSARRAAGAALTPGGRKPRMKCAGRGSAPFSLRGKEKAAGGKKKTPKGDLRRNKLHIPRFRAGREISSVSLFLLFPHESLRWIRAGALAPLQSPLKRPRRGCCPFLDFSQEFGLCRGKLQIDKTRCRCAFDRPAR